MLCVNDVAERSQEVIARAVPAKIARLARAFICIVFGGDGLVGPRPSAQRSEGRWPVFGDVVQ